MKTDNTYTYAGRNIVDRTPMPGARMLFIACSDGVQPWVTGFLGEDNGQYFTESKDAWKNYALRLAEGLGLVVAPAGAVVLTAEQVEQVQTTSADLAKGLDEFERMLGTDNCESHVRLQVEDTIANSVIEMNRLLGDLQLHTPPVYEPEEGDEDEAAAVETPQHTSGTFVEAVTGGENWNR
ncbi:hypothetical protein ACIQVR_26860 [Streptomyces xanthochromogenes]|uniref:hypothetical protein n=1 Tax=Streptomyces xanthochromogenes TaxID=67384 RepID=UPI003821139E